MLFTTPPRLFHFRLLALLAVLAGLASGCQSSRPSFSFQPAPGRVRAVAVPETATAEASSATPAAATAFAKQPVNGAPGRVQIRPWVQPVPEAVLLAAPAAIALTPTLRPAAKHRRALLTRPHASAEVGLGTTVLGVLGLITLPIALLGLLLSGGGLVWGLVAGAAALAVLVAYLDPFG